jgi:hypothetical protein
MIYHFKNNFILYSNMIEFLKVFNLENVEDWYLIDRYILQNKKK